MQSEQVSTTSFASITREQSIYLSQISSYGGVWEVVTPDPMKRPASRKRLWLAWRGNGP